MAATLLLLAALATAEPQTPEASAEKSRETLFNSAVGCSAYHVYTVVTAVPESEAEKLGQEKAVMFLLASYATMPQDQPVEVEAKIEELVNGLLEDSRTIEPERHKSEIEQLGQVCALFEPRALAIIDEEGYNAEN